MHRSSPPSRYRAGSRPLSFTTTPIIRVASEATSATNWPTAFSATLAPPLTEEGERNHNGGIEAEVNFLGGALLITNEAAIHVVSEGLVANAHNLYGVSPAMLTYRRRMSGAHRIYERRVQQARRAG